MALRSKVEQDEVMVARFGGRTSVWLVQVLAPSRHRSSSPRLGPSALRCVTSAFNASTKGPEVTRFTAGFAKDKGIGRRTFSM
ncbi:hypothetical protein DVH24_027662 [Malus domestica]|uniref:Uncharacterized protein n=1 Tax=Malus domestica TaxID=3750 RepID=A0A498HDK6_MALDO|nr:hypothetical protein DVH24_027662 [Malus domestica]